MTVSVTHLDNGLTVVSDAMDTVETVSVGVWVEAGTRYETAAQNGISHLLEHMAFKGTPSRSAQAIAEEIEAVGGHLNAYTSRENTAYYAKVLKEDAGLALTILADILQHSTFDPVELGREQTVILQEIAQADDAPDDIVFDYFQAAAFPDQPIGRPVLGTGAIVKGLTRETLNAYLARHYGPKRLVVSAAGKVAHDWLVERSRDLFVELPAAPAADCPPARYRGGENRTSRDIEQTHVLLGFEGVAYTDDDYYPLSVLSSLLGGGMSSRLFQEVREKRGLAYSVYSFSSFYQDSGLFGVYAGTGEKEVAELVPVLCDEILKVTEMVGAEELARARAQLKASVLMSLESTSARCEQLARQMQVFHRPIPPLESVAHIEAVDAQAVRRAAKRLLGSPLTLTALGPLDGLESYDRIRDRLKI